MLKLKLLFAACIIMLAASSCKTNKNSLTYFQDLTGIDAGVLSQMENTITIKPADELLITVSSSEPSATLDFNAPLVNPALASQLNVQTQPQIQTYIVDSKGNIDMPTLGEIHVEGLTTEQLTADLLARISKTVNDPYVRVELVNFQVNVLGEVRRPGMIGKPVAYDHLTVLQAIGMSGDMTEYSDRSNVMVLRKENGKITYHRLNLNESNSIESPYFYLQQGDMIIVPPSQSRESNSRYDTNNSYRMQIVSTIVSACSVVASLIIALVVK